MRHPQPLYLPAAVCLSGFCVAPVAAQVQVLSEDFQTGTQSVDWDLFDASVDSEFTPAINYFGHIQDAANGGAGVTLTNLDGLGSPGASDFSISLDFRIDTVESNRRMFNLMVNGDSSSPTASGSAVNLRYYNDTWQAYNGSAWTGLALPTIAPNTWHSLTLTGSNWGTGVAGASQYDLTLNGGSTLAGLQVFQNNADIKLARSVALTDRWDGATNGFDIDNLLIEATAAAAPPPNTTTIIPTAPVAYSGVYAHTAVTNGHNEAAVGALLNRNGKVWFVTYGPHVTTGGSDELYSVDLNTLEHKTWHDYPGNTDANRYTDNNLGVDFIGAAYIDHATETVRYLPVTSPGAGDAVGRFTGTAAHLTDPNKIYYMTMEEGLYEVDFSDLNSPVITTLRVDGNHGGSRNLPGVHGKGLFTGQGHLFFTNNGNGGSLVEWDGTGDPENLSAWTVVDNENYTEVTSRQGPVDMDPNSTDAIWATGWDDDSIFINTRDAATGQWTKLRMAKGSYTHERDHGWYTEWPRIRDVGLEGGYLFSHHGMMFLVPETFAADNYGGLTPLVTHHKMIVDYVEDGNRIVFAGNDATKFSNSLVPKANSNIFFLDKADLPSYGGTARGYGGVWVDDSVSANEYSDAFLITGFRDRVVHLDHNNNSAVNFTLEVDENGDGNWTTHTVVNVPGTAGPNGGYGYYILPEGVSAQWLRVKTDQAVSSATAYLHVGNTGRARDSAMTASLADPASPAARSQGIIRSRSGADFKLEYAADMLDANGNITGTGYYQAQLNPVTAALELVAVNDAAAEASVRNNAATSQDFGVDDASVFVDDDGTRYRLPKGHSAFDSATASGWRRGEREVVTERAVANIHGTFYEVPRNFTGGTFRRIVPITTHNLDIFDFASWRGMLVLSGVIDGGAVDGHYLESDDGQAGLWFGNVDDLYSFGTPVGEGGPWMETSIAADAASDPFLMAGYDHKVLELSHDSGGDVTFTIEVDFLGTGQWEVYGDLTVAPGETLEYIFEQGYSAHWVRLVSDTSTTATAQFTYSVLATFDPADLDADGDVDDADFGLAFAAFTGPNNGPSSNPAADLDGDGDVDDADFGIAFAAFTGPGGPANVPEPTSLALMGLGGLLLSRRRR